VVGEDSAERLLVASPMPLRRCDIASAEVIDKIRVGNSKGVELCPRHASRTRR
jgi:hypothetical protein